MNEREYDLVVFGATGFTGRQAARYVADRAPPELRLAVAARDPGRLETLASGLGRPVGRVVCDATDADAVDRMVSDARVVATTAGPFARYGQHLVEACTRHGTHYADITGETPWVRGLIDTLHDSAAAAGTRIVPFCGFDSVPSDLGTLIAVQHLRRAHGEGCRRVTGMFRARGGVNGGTLATFFAMDAADRAAMRDPVLLNPPGFRQRDEVPAEPDPLLPRWDPRSHAWLAPFVMGAINTRVVRRSAALESQWGTPYGPGFRYQEYWKAEGALGGFEAVALGGAQLGAQGLAALAPLRRLAERFAPPPGSGPSEAQMDAGFYRCELLAEGESGRRIRVTLADRGDPGNRATVKMLGESALALAVDEARLPGAPGRGGILTPATAIGEILAERLARAGTRIDVEDL